MPRIERWGSNYVRHVHVEVLWGHKIMEVRDLLEFLYKKTTGKYTSRLPLSGVVEDMFAGTDYL